MAEGFAIWRPPGQSNWSGIRGGFTCPSHPAAFSAEPAFYIQPWNRSAGVECLTGRFSSDPDVLRSWMEEFALPEVSSQAEMQEEAWAAYIKGIKNGIADGVLQKAVASRVKRSPGGRNAFSSFRKACESYPDAMVCLLVHPTWGCWLVATPELLLSTDSEGHMQSMALAGTLLPDSGGWTPKEEEENAATRRFIEKVLMDAGASDLAITASPDISSGALRHLAFRYSFNLNPEQTGALLKALHPTPAVGGLPLQLALEMIAAREPHDRRLYTGWIGYSDAAGFSSFVNLRCAQLDADGAWLYAGAGINRGSQADAEWRETAAKMDVIGRCLDDQR